MVAISYNLCFNFLRGNIDEKCHFAIVIVRITSIFCPEKEGFSTNILIYKTCHNFYYIFVRYKKMEPATFANISYTLFKIEFSILFNFNSSRRDSRK